MSGKRYLRKKQLAVIDELFDGELDEQGVLARHKVSRLIFNKWLGDKIFREEFDRRIDWGRRQSEMLVSKYTPLAMAKLIQLTDSDKGETARKACLDIIALRDASAQRGDEAKEDGDEGLGAEISDEMCSKLLSVLADGK